MPKGGAASWTTYYAAHFGDDFAPVLLFLTRTQARRDTIRDAANERAEAEKRRFDVRSLTIEEAAAELRSLFVHETLSSSCRPLASASLRVPDGIVMAQEDLDLLRRVLDESLHTIQAVRHALRAGRAPTIEPSYPEQAQVARDLLQRLRKSSLDNSRVPNKQRTDRTDTARRR